MKLMEDCREYHEGLVQRSSEDRVFGMGAKAKSQSSGFQYPQNRKTIRQEASIPDEVETDASDYYKKSKGE